MIDWLWGLATAMTVIFIILLMAGLSAGVLYLMWLVALGR